MQLYWGKSRLMNVSVRGVKNWFRRHLAQASDAVVGRVLSHIIPVWRAGRPIPVEADRASLANLYRTASLCHACIKEKATSAAEPEFRAELGGQRLPDDDLLGELAVRPNPDTTPYEFTERIVTDLDTFGEWIAQKRRSRTGIVREVWPLQVEHVEVITDKNGTIVQYEIAKTATLKPSDVIHIKYPNPLNPWRGLSPLFVLAMEGGLDKDSVLYLSEFFRNGGIPSHVITSAAELTPPERETISEEYAEVYGRRGGVAGDTGWHGAMVLSHGGTIQPLGADPTKLDLAPIFDMTESRVCAVMGVPAILVGANVGLKQAQAYGTAREGKISFWEETLAALYVRLSQALTLGLAAEFGQGYALRYDLSMVQPLQRARSPIIRDSVLMWTQGLVTRDRALERIGEAPVDGRPVYKYELDAETKRANTALAMEAGISIAAAGRPLPELQGETEIKAA